MYYNPNYIEWGSPQGWRCPGCGRYYSPSTVMCFYCGGNQRTWTSPTTTSPSTDDSQWWEEYLKRSTTGKGTCDNPSTTTAKSTESWVEHTASGAIIYHGKPPEVYY